MTVYIESREPRVKYQEARIKLEGSRYERFPHYLTLDFWLFILYCYFLK